MTLREQEQVEIRVIRYAGGTWRVRVRHPFGSWEDHRGVPDWDSAVLILDDVLRKMEQAATSESAS